MSTATLAPFTSTPVRVPQPKRWTVAEFHEILGNSAFENHRLILIEGDILQMPNPNPPHDMSLGLTEAAMRAAFGVGHWVRGQMAMVVGVSTDPVPDIAVVRGSPRDYPNYPRTALLVVEIAESSLAYDTHEKANLYAAAGIADYWVVDLIHRQLHVFRDPIVDATQMFGAAYRTRQSLDSTATLSPLTAPSALISVSNLLP